MARPSPKLPVVHQISILGHFRIAASSTVHDCALLRIDCASTVHDCALLRSTVHRLCTTVHCCASTVHRLCKAALDCASTVHRLCKAALDCASTVHDCALLCSTVRGCAALKAIKTPRFSRERDIEEHREKIPPSLRDPTTNQKSPLTSNQSNTSSPLSLSPLNLSPLITSVNKLASHQTAAVNKSNST